MIIDFHTHCFPDTLAAGALNSLGREGGGLLPHTDGTAAGLKARCKAAGVDKAVVLHIATNERQQEKVNRFASSIQDETLVSFGSVYPRSETALDQVRLIKELGLKGVKLHPEYQDFFVDDPAVFPLYEAIGELGLITVFHAGKDIGFPRPEKCLPAALARALPHFKGAPVVAAHFGGYLLWDDVLEHLAGRDVYLDTSYCFSKIPRPTALEILNKHGSQRILYGSDTPWSDMALEQRLVQSIARNDRELADILGGNAARLLQI